MPTHRPTLEPSWPTRAVTIAPRHPRLRRVLAAEPSSDRTVDLCLVVATVDPAWARAALEDSQPSFRSTLVAEVAGAITSARLGEWQAAPTLFAEAIGHARIAADERVLAWALAEGGRVSGIRGDSVRALERLQEGLDLARRLAIDQLEAAILTNLGMVHGQAARPSEFAAFTRQAIAAHRAVGDAVGVAFGLCNLGGALEALGQSDEALRCYDEAEAAVRDVESPIVAALACAGRGGTHFSRGEVERAHAAYRESAQILESIGERVQVARQLLLQAEACARLGRDPCALAHCEEAAALPVSQTLRPLAARLAEFRAEVLWRMGRHEEAREAYRQCIAAHQVNLDEQVQVVEQGAARGQALVLALKEASWERERRLAAEEDARALSLALAEQAALREELERVARTDPLTGLPNRRAFDEHLRWLVAQAHRSQRPAALLLLDVDHFKKVNDRFGHAVGDQVLRALAHPADVPMRQSDLYSRWGGEEFALLLVDTDEAGARVLAEKFREAIRATPVATTAGPIPLTVSIGLAILEAGLSADAWIRRADEALYTAKRLGRDRVVCWQRGTPASLAPSVGPPRR